MVEQVERLPFGAVKFPQQDSIFLVEPFPLPSRFWWQGCKLLCYPMVAGLSPPPSISSLLRGPATEQVGVGWFTHSVDAWMGQITTAAVVTERRPSFPLGTTLAHLLNSPHSGCRAQLLPLGVTL